MQCICIYDSQAHNSRTLGCELILNRYPLIFFVLTSDGAAWSILRTVSVSECLCPEHGNRNAWECYFTHPLHLMRSFCQWCEKNSLTLQAFLHQCKSSKLKRHLFNKTNLGRESHFQGCSDWMRFLSLNSLPWGSDSTLGIVVLQKNMH